MTFDKYKIIKFLKIKMSLFFYTYEFMHPKKSEERSVPLVRATHLKPFSERALDINLYSSWVLNRHT